MTTKKRALISVTDKEGVVDFARGLVALGFEILSTSGTARLLRDADVAITDVKDATGFPEILGGRVKTLHPKIHGGILARRDQASDRADLESHAIVPIDVVAVNLYAFERTVASADVSLEDAIESIDIGGPAMLRASAKNHAHVVVVVDPRDYTKILDSLNAGSLDASERLKLARKVFRHVSHYDGQIAAFLDRQIEAEAYPETLVRQYRKIQDLRYGENPHQSAAFYREENPPPHSLADAKQLSGKELSFNNLLDTDSAWNLTVDLGSNAVVYVKHNNPCGVARHASLAEAVRLARACDPLSSFGAVVALSRTVDAETATVLGETFVEVIVAPAFSEEALGILQSKKNLRLLEMGSATRPTNPGWELRCVNGGVLVQERDLKGDPADEIRNATVASKRAPTIEEKRALEFAWVVAKHVRSNAIVFSHSDRIAAVGAGQMSRVDSVKLCALRGPDALKGAVVASDAFFPFRDGIDMLAKAGASAIVQPGGSIRDDEVIQAADEHGLAMIFTGVRHFRH